MKIIRSRLVPFKGYNAINLLGILFCRKGVELTPSLLNHERIHTRQMVEMAVVGFHLWYVVEWLVRLPMKGSAYFNISFEREAYANQWDEHYLEHRRPYSWTKYLRSKKGGS